MAEWTKYVRDQFPSLRNEVNGRRLAYFDGPGGYQVPQRVIDAVVGYLTVANANAEGSYSTSIRTDEILEEARRAFADFFGCSWTEVSFGNNMTTLNFMLAEAVARDLRPGDRILVTQIDHESNRGPWLELAERGIVVDEARFDPSTCTLDMDDVRKKVTPATKVVACNYASNAVGTISDVKMICSWAHDVGALAVVDAVHYAAHGPIDVRDLDVDFLLCSAYKFFGTHIGVMYSRAKALSELRTLQVRPARHDPPYRIETGTLNHEGIAGAAAAVDFIADLGARFGRSATSNPGDPPARRENIVRGLTAIDRYEQPLAAHLQEGLSEIEGVTLYGPPTGHPRTSTVSFAHDEFRADLLARYLNEDGVLVWDGDFYATTLVEHLGLANRGGLVRFGIAPYNTAAEVDLALDLLRDTHGMRRFAKSEQGKVVRAH